MFASSTKILVVDDSSTMRKTVIHALGGLGYTEFVEANDGNEAWDLLSDSKNGIELIFSDQNMPGCTGLELLKKIRAESRYNSVAFILVTADGERELIKAAAEAGASQFVSKPIEPEALKAKLQKAADRVGK
jgi:two-component system chemotaxis response regulator CheY